MNTSPKYVFDIIAERTALGANYSLSLPSYQGINKRKKMRPERYTINSVDDLVQGSQIVFKIRQCEDARENSPEGIKKGLVMWIF